MDLTKPIHFIVDTVTKSNGSFVEILSAYLTPVIAVLAALIAYQQYRINKQRFLFETYEKRLKIFDVVQDFLIQIMMHGKTDYEKCGLFAKNTSQVIFLFDKSIRKKVDEIYDNAIKMVELDEQLYPSDGSNGLPVGDERNKVAKEKSNYVKWFNEQRNITKKLFSRKMSLK